MLQHFKKSKKILLNQINFNRYVESIRWSEIFKTFLKTIRICFIINITSFLALTTLLRVFLYKILKTLFKNWTQPKVALIDVFLLLCITIKIFKTFLKTIRICFIINITSFLALTTLLRVFLYKILKTLFKNWTQPKVALIDVFLLLCITITFYSLHYNTYIQNKWIAYCGGCLFTIIIFTAKNIITTIFRKIYYKIKNK